jgi:hypothetical protein
MKDPDTLKPSEPIYEVYAATRINGYLEQQTALTVGNPVLDAVEKGELSIEQWQEFIRQRHLAAINFEGLLESGKRKAYELGDEELEEVLAANLRDERGLNSVGQKLKIGPHSKWRKDFHEALGVDSSSLETTSPSAGTQEYNAAIRGLIDSENVLTVAGALLFQEYSIPHEFERIQIGRDITFPSLFVVEPDDTTAQRRAKLASRLYLDHHIAHDANLHFPALMESIHKYVHVQGSLRDILNGIFIVSEAKKRFYESLGQVLLK